MTHPALHHLVYTAEAAIHIFHSLRSEIPCHPIDASRLETICENMELMLGKQIRTEIDLGNAYADIVIIEQELPGQLNGALTVVLYANAASTFAYDAVVQAELLIDDHCTVYTRRGAENRKKDDTMADVHDLILERLCRA